jgi:hypothetical protein
MFIKNLNNSNSHQQFNWQMEITALQGTNTELFFNKTKSNFISEEV